MPVFETLRDTLLGGTDTPATYRCEECGADFSLTDAPDAVNVECRYCGGTDVSVRG